MRSPQLPSLQAALVTAAALAGLACASPVDDSLVVDRSVSVFADPYQAPRRAETVKRGQNYRVAVTFAWPDGGSRGRHRRVWRFRRDGQLFGEDAATVRFDRSPFTLELVARSADKPPGLYEYELRVDDVPVATLRVPIVD